jgi:lambda family phage minor tail protein L
MSIRTEIQLLAPTARLEFFVLDATNFPGGGLTYIHPETNELKFPVIWQGQTYAAAPASSEGFDATTKGSLPRPKFRIANLDGAISAQVLQFDDLIGAKLTRKQTFARFLDAANFPSGVNPTADPNAFLPDEIWFVEQKLQETRQYIEWELSSAFDVQGVLLPGRAVVQNYCPWKYRGAECGYTGTAAFDINDQSVSLANDVCSKRLHSCEIRFNSQGIKILPFGGFPGAVRYEDQFQ